MAAPKRQCVSLGHLDGRAGVSSRKILFENILWAKEHLEPVEPQYCIVFKTPGQEGSVSVVHPAPEWLAMAMHGGLLPTIDVMHLIRCEWTNEETGETCVTPLNEYMSPPWGKGKVLNGELLHTGPRAPAMTEEEAMEYLLQKDVPRAVWFDHEHKNDPDFYIIRRDMLPKSRAFRNAWRLIPPERLQAA